MQWVCHNRRQLSKRLYLFLVSPYSATNNLKLQENAACRKKVREFGLMMQKINIDVCASVESGFLSGEKLNAGQKNNEC